MGDNHHPETVNSARQQGIWNHFQAPQASNCFDSARPRYLCMARRVAGRHRVLNIGVGAGGLERQLEQVQPGVIHSIDPSLVAIQRLHRELGMGARAIVGVIDALPFSDGYFDAVVLSEVLEHLAPEEARRGLCEIDRVLKPGGMLVGTVPADETLSDNFVVCPCCGETFHRWGHLQSFSSDQLKRLLEERFESVSVAYRAFPDWSRRGVYAQLKSAMRALLGRFGVSIAQPNLLFQVTKPLDAGSFGP